MCLAIIILHDNWTKAVRMRQTDNACAVFSRKLRRFKLPTWTSIVLQLSAFYPSRHEFKGTPSLNSSGSVGFLSWNGCRPSSSPPSSLRHACYKRIPPGSLGAESGEHSSVNIAIFSRFSQATHIKAGMNESPMRNSTTSE